MNSKLRRSPLFEVYPPDVPTMEFGGWEMPRDFGGIIREHRSVRESVGVFDLSHMGRFVVRGEDAATQLSRLFTRDLDDVEPGRALYGFFCREDGGCIDDDILYLRSPREVWMVVNAANRQPVLEWLRKHLEGTVEDRTTSTVLLAVQGPEAPRALRELGVEPFPERPFRTAWSGETLHATTGYTGEAGGELWLPRGDGIQLFERIKERDLTLCGLGARDTLRLEKAYPLHGHELSLEIDPITAGLERFVDWDHEFTGRGALRKRSRDGPERRLAGLATEGRRSPRRNQPVRDPDGAEIGQVTSGRFSPTLEHGIGLALVDGQFPEDRDVEVKIRDRWHRVRQVEPPFV